MATFESLLAGRNLSGTIEGIKTGLPVRVPPSFLNVTDKVSGHTAEWFEVDGNRDLAKVVSQDSPARRVGLRDVKSKSSTMFRTFESQNFVANKLRNLLRMDGVGTGVRDDKGAEFVKDQAVWFKKRQQNLFQTCVQVMLGKFELNFNSAGDLLTSSSGAAFSINPGIPDGQKSQLNILNSGSIIGTKWDTASADIIGNIAEIKRQMLVLGNWEITHAFYGRDIAKYIGKNDVCKEYINQTPALATQRWSGANIIPQGFQDLTWVPMSDAYYLDANGTAQNCLAADEIVFTPSPDSSWWRVFSGTEMVPNGTVQVGQSIDQALGGLTEVQGEFMYAAVNHNPVSVDLFAGNNFLPLICATKAVCKADVDF